MRDRALSVVVPSIVGVGSLRPRLRDSTPRDQSARWNSSMAVCHRSYPPPTGQSAAGLSRRCCCHARTIGSGRDWTSFQRRRSHVDIPAFAPSDLRFGGSRRAPQNVLERAASRSWIPAERRDPDSLRHQRTISIAFSSETRKHAWTSTGPIRQRNARRTCCDRKIAPVFAIRVCSAARGGDHEDGKRGRTDSLQTMAIPAVGRDHQRFRGSWRMRRIAARS